MFSHKSLYDKPAYIAAREIDGADLTIEQKAETALKVGLPILDPAVAPIAKRLVAAADKLEIEAPAIEQIRQMLDADAAQMKLQGHSKGRARQAKASPILERPLWDKLLSDD